MKNCKKLLRQSFPEHEKKYYWLPMLLDAYYLNDIGVLDERKIETRKREQKIACGKRCYYCCLKPAVPITEIEIMGISWYISEILSDPVIRNRLKEQLIHHNDVTQCPFLIDRICSIYIVRPIACREYHIFGEPCKRNEIPEETRPHDVWSPSRRVARKTASKLLPYYGFKNQVDIDRAYERGFIHENSKPMHLINWSGFSRVMNLFDTRLDNK